MFNRRRMIAAAMLVCALMVLLAASAMIVHEADHDCTGEDCPICAFIAQAVALRRSLGAAVTIALALPACAAVVCAHTAASILCIDFTPVLKKVRLND